MGGNAFKTLPSAAFPRMPAAVYLALKERLKPKLSEIYELVAVPIEAPEKKDYGDLDFIVALPRQDDTPKDVQVALGATHAILMDGNRTSNFALPVSCGEWTMLGHQSEETFYRSQLQLTGLSLDAEAGNIERIDDLFYQVDVHVCANEAEWKRIAFFNGHGDMGMILGLLMRNHGLHLGNKGLKVPDPPNPPFELSDNFDDILRFMGLSTETPRSSFQTKQEVFEWLGSSRFFDPNSFRSSGAGITKVKSERKMYYDFVRWAESQRTNASGQVESRSTSDAKRVRAEALAFFNKTEAFEAVTKERVVRVQVKGLWCGHNVRDWAGLGEYWVGVKRIMDGVRAEFGGDAGIAGLLEGGDAESVLKRKVLEVRDRLGIIPRTGAR